MAGLENANQDAPITPQCARWLCPSDQRMPPDPLHESIRVGAVRLPSARLDRGADHQPRQAAHVDHGPVGQMASIFLAPQLHVLFATAIAALPILQSYCRVRAMRPNQRRQTSESVRDMPP